MYGGGGDDFYYGGSGSDVMMDDLDESDDLFDEGAGADEMVGSDGDGIYYVDNSDDIVMDSAGHNIIYSTAPFYNLGDEDDNVIDATYLVGDAGQSLVGQSWGDFIVGSGFNDVIDGSYSDDLIFGGSGHDTLIGGTENAPDWIGDDQLFGQAATTLCAAAKAKTSFAEAPARTR